MSAGFINYNWFFAKDFKFKDDTTQEIYITAESSEVFLTPKLSIFYDFANGDGFYLSLDLAHMMGISKGKSISMNAVLSASLGYNGGQWLTDDSDPGFSDLNIGISFPINLKNFKITPFFTYTNVLMDAIGKEDHYWFGISINYEKILF